MIPKILLATLRANTEEPNWNRKESAESFFGIGHQFQKLKKQRNIVFELDYGGVQTFVI